MKHWIGISEFVAVAEQQSFTKAAKVLGISVAQDFLVLCFTAALACERLTQPWRRRFPW